MLSPTDDCTRAKRTAVRRQGSYGLDAPRLLPIFALLVLADLADGIFSRSIGPLVAASVILACGALGFYASRRGKFVVWARLLDEFGPYEEMKARTLAIARGKLKPKVLSYLWVRAGMNIRFYLDPATGQPHILNHGVDESEVPTSWKLRARTDRDATEPELRLVKRGRGATCV